MRSCIERMKIVCLKWPPCFNAADASAADAAATADTVIDVGFHIIYTYDV